MSEVLFKDDEWEIFRPDFTPLTLLPLFVLVHTPHRKRDWYRNSIEDTAYPCVMCGLVPPDHIQTIFLFLVTGDPP